MRNNTIGFLGFVRSCNIPASLLQNLIRPLKGFLRDLTPGYHNFSFFKVCNIRKKINYATFFFVFFNTIYIPDKALTGNKLLPARKTKFRPMLPGTDTGGKKRVFLWNYIREYKLP